MTAQPAAKAPLRTKVIAGALISMLVIDELSYVRRWASRRWERWLVGIEWRDRRQLHVLEAALVSMFWNRVASERSSDPSTAR